MNKIKITVCGAAGRMGNAILRLAATGDQFVITGAVESSGHPSIGSPLVFAGTEAGEITGDFGTAAKKADVIIDFTAVMATLDHLAVAEKLRKPIVIGTTGFKQAEIAEVRKASLKIPVVFTPNMSVGVNALFNLVKEAASAVPDYDVEIVELHHNQKKDAPSGTAARLAKIIADTLKRNLEKVGIYGRQGIVGARKKEEIGILAVRGGDIVGEHTVYFVGPGERIELTHRLQSRDALAAGALVAAKWLAKQKPGLYDMQDVLNLK
ncbi:MAG: 4-hydroxy-tetrahydrodipicolinate reductase [Elusimicrobiota bacterium]